MDTEKSQPASWASGDAYEPYVGRWSRLVAPKFLEWLSVKPRSAWLDVGCGTGALTQTILRGTDPTLVAGIDRSLEYVNFTHSHISDPRACFATGDAQHLPVRSGVFRASVSGLVLNFVPSPAEMVLAMRRAVHEDGIVAVYVWDYAGQMQLMRHFWDAAGALDSAAQTLDEGRRFPICNPHALQDLFQNTDLQDVETTAIDVETRFSDFDDYWTPFLGGQGPAPSYTMSLPADSRNRLRDAIRASLPIAADGSLHLIARAWAVKGRRRTVK